jgi:hypothetical protein
LSLVAQRINGEDDATKSLKMLLLDVMAEPKERDGGAESEDEEETAEEKHVRQASERERMRKKKEQKEKREVEANARAEADFAVEEEARLAGESEKATKAEEARKRAVGRLSKAKAGMFSLTPDQTENLRLLFEHYALSPALGLKRNSWIELMTSLGVEDDLTVMRSDTSAAFEAVRVNKASSGLSLEEFTRGFAVLSERRFPPEDGKSTEKSLAEALTRMLSMCMEG